MFIKDITMANIFVSPEYLDLCNTYYSPKLYFKVLPQLENSIRYFFYLDDP